MPSLPSTQRRVPSGHGTKSSILYLHSPAKVYSPAVRGPLNPGLPQGTDPQSLLVLHHGANGHANRNLGAGSEQIHVRIVAGAVHTHVPFIPWRPRLGARQKQARSLTPRPPKSFGAHTLFQLTTHLVCPKLLHRHST